jgi:DNA-binding response OmpR family regulator
LSIKKILIVDDEIPIHNYLKKKFTKLGYEVSVADEGHSALDRAFLFLPDILLLDIKLPGLNGIEVCKILKSDEKTKHIPIIMLSAKAQTEEIEEGLKAGADKYLCKPIGFPDILKEIRRFEDS